MDTADSQTSSHINSLNDLKRNIKTTLDALPNDYALQEHLYDIQTTIHQKICAIFKADAAIEGHINKPGTNVSSTH